ncbi:MAG: hypothetical protein ACTSYM_08725 [Candidatus Baldrarchaeia archaeon]
MDGYRISLWSPEIFAVLSMVPCLLITYFSEKFQAYIHIVYVEGWRHISGGVLTVSGLLFTFTLISLLVGVYSNLKFGNNILIVKRIFYTITFGLGIQYVGYEVSEFFLAAYERLTNPEVVEFSYGLGHPMLILQFILLTLSFMTVWLTKEQPVSL